jgi:NAD(P)-dependent dehydrogenase (short-subunit alcohol dehydrogenase family)
MLTIATRRGAIVNILDQRVLKLRPDYYSYTLSKAALHTATTTMAQALAPRIRVNAVAPGPVLPNTQEGSAGFDREIAGVPLTRAVRPEEIAAAVLHLARAEGTTGQTLAVDAGQGIGWRTPDFTD